MKKLILLFAILIAAMFTLPSYAQDQTVTRTTWGALKAKYRPNVPTPSQSVNETGRATTKPGAEMSAVNYSIRIRPYAVNEFWVDPNNPSSGKHVVLFFRFETNMSREIKLRLYANQVRTDFNSWQAWYSYPTANTQEVKFFVDGRFWWINRLIYSPWVLSQRFELCF